MSRRHSLKGHHGRTGSHHSNYYVTRGGIRM